jgi:phosphatidylglycerol:prolipoprotein diacylglycerol transferase
VAPRDLVPPQDLPAGFARRQGNGAAPNAGQAAPATTPGTVSASAQAAAAAALAESARTGGPAAGTKPARPGRESTDAKPAAGTKPAATKPTAAAKRAADATHTAGIKPAATGMKPAADIALPAGGSTVAGGTAAGTRADDAGADDVPQWAAKALQQLLTVTYWLDPGEAGEPFSATIKFTGQRTDVTGPSQPGDTFSQEETVDKIVPGSGPVAVTAEVRDINPGTWKVTARPVSRGAARNDAGSLPGPAAPGRVPPPRRVTVPGTADDTLKTTTLLRSRVPGVIRYAYACLVGLGVLTGLGIEALLLDTSHYTLLRPIMFSVAAVAAGVIGGKTWYAAVHRGRKWDGWCIQGFVAGTAVVVAAVAVAGAGLPAGAFLAAATPALLIGMGIGRHGCFWAGCCTGRPTASRWGIWSSDRRLGCRRMPVQLYEAWTALAVGTLALVVVLLAGLHRSGPVAIAGLATYTLVRQLILGLRDEPRAWRYGRPVTATVAAAALITGIALIAVGA